MEIGFFEKSSLAASGSKGSKPNVFFITSGNLTG
jgi:hypothetical protein